NNEKTGHLDFNLGWDKWAYLTSITYSEFGDLRMGSLENADYKRLEYAVNIEGNDTVIANEDPDIQKITGYNQINLMHKIRFRENFIRYLERSGQINSYKNSLEKVNEALDKDIEKLFYSFLEGEMGIVFSDLKNLTREENTYVVFKTKSKSLAEESLTDLLRNYSRKTNQQFSSFVFSYQVDAETSWLIYQMPLHFLPEKLFGGLFAGGRCEYFTFVDNYMVFANSIQAFPYRLRFFF
ncbi:unnamed protein product, partial [marine sediment metagenome]